MRSREVELVESVGSGLLRMPDVGAARAGVVALHGAVLPDREQPLFDHLAQTIIPLGYAVLSYDRRPPCDGGDVPLAAQACDALAAAAVLSGELSAPVGLFGFSQGAWAAVRAASMSRDIAFLALLGCSGVSPAEQMRYFTDEALRRAAYGRADRDQALQARVAMEDVLRGTGDRRRAEALLGEASRRPWFALAYLSSELPPGAAWADMDYDPASDLEQVGCPILAMYGEDDEAIPAVRSKQVLLDATSASKNTQLTLADLPGCGHFPTSPRPGDDHVSSLPISSDYAEILSGWFDGLPDDLGVS